MIGTILFCAQLLFWLLVYAVGVYVLWRYGPHDGSRSAPVVTLILLWPFVLAALMAAAIAEVALRAALGAGRFVRNVLR